MSPGFPSVGHWADSAGDAGKNWLSTFRKVPAAVTIAGQWFDFSTAAGSPPANFYASEPLVAATLASAKGIYHGPSVTPAKKYISRLMTMNGASGPTITTSQNVAQIFMDYLLYYPFIDLDAVGIDQTLDNTAPAAQLTRYTTGAGVRMMLVAQGVTAGSGVFTVTYHNQAGAVKTTPNHYCAAAQPFGALVSGTTAAGGLHPFLTLAAGDTGVRDVISLNMSVGNGGLGCLVLVKPLQNHYQLEESRRTTASTLESFGSPQETEAIRLRAGTNAPIEDGAFLSFIGLTAMGSVSGAQFVGLLETVWR